MKYRDAAKVMSVPVGTVKSRLHAAIQRLGAAWREFATGKPIVSPPARRHARRARANDVGTSLPCATRYCRAAGLLIAIAHRGAWRGPAAMTDELVAYLLDDMCPERRAEIEQRLQSDRAWQRELERLKDCLAATGDPAKCIEDPPRDLVHRTCCYVTQVDNVHGSVDVPAPVAGRAAVVAAPALPAATTSLSLADVAVGGGVLLLVGMLVVPALRESRDATRRLACQDEPANARHGPVRVSGKPRPLAADDRPPATRQASSPLRWPMIWVSTAGSWQP